MLQETYVFSYLLLTNVLSQSVYTLVIQQDEAKKADNTSLGISKRCLLKLGDFFLRVTFQ
jgi:hypothetical protein